MRRTCEQKTECLGGLVPQHLYKKWDPLDLSLKKQGRWSQANALPPHRRLQHGRAFSDHGGRAGEATGASASDRNMAWPQLGASGLLRTKYSWGFL